MVARASGVVGPARTIDRTRRPTRDDAGGWISNKGADAGDAAAGLEEPVAGRRFARTAPTRRLRAYGGRAAVVGAASP